MKRLTPSFIGTTIATIIAALYTFFFHEGFHLWNSAIRGLVLGGPIVVLLTYTVITFLLEKHLDDTNLKKGLGPLDYPFRVLAQIALGLALAALGENVAYYVVMFMIFVAFNTAVSISSRDVTRRLVFTDVFNFIISAAYTCVALALYSKASGFEATYAAFSVDQESYGFRVNQLRGEQTNLLLALAACVGGMVANILQVLNWPGWKEMDTKKVQTDTTVVANAAGDL